MNLPDKFQMRVATRPGFTHTVTKNTQGGYEVKWARGYPDAIGALPRKVFDAYEVESFVEQQRWILVDERKKVEKKPLPDEFEFTLEDTCEYSEGVVYSAKRTYADNYKVSWTKPWKGFIHYPEKQVEGLVKNGSWNILEKKTASKYPDVFHIISYNDKYTLHKIGEKWVCTYYGMSLDEQKEKNGGDLAMYNETTLTSLFESGCYQLYEPKKLTQEQLARNKEIQEQIEQLNKSIDECDNFKENLWVQIQHYNTLIKSYEDRIEVLKKGLVEE